MASETIEQRLTNRPITRLGICPFSLHVNPPSPIEIAGPEGTPRVAEQKIDLCNCVGSACHLWQFEVGTDPRTGDCALNIAAQAASLTANYMHQMFAAAQQQNRVEQEN